MGHLVYVLWIYKRMCALGGEWYSSVVELVLGMHKVLDSIPSAYVKGKNN